MSTEQREHTRFSLDIPATLHGRYGEQHGTFLQQISIGGCLTYWEENIYPGDEFRLEVELPNKNRLPLKCKAVYRFDEVGIGVKFLDLSKFEQELIARIIESRLQDEGLPLPTNPFNKPPQFTQPSNPMQFSDREMREQRLEEVMSNDPD